MDITKLLLKFYSVTSYRKFSTYFTARQFLNCLPSFDSTGNAQYLISFYNLDLLVSSCILDQDIRFTKSILTVSRLGYRSTCKHITFLGSKTTALNVKYEITVYWTNRISCPHQYTQNKGISFSDL